MSVRHHIVVFTASLSYSVRKGIVAVDRAVPNLDWLVLLHVPSRGLPKLLRSQWRNLRRNGVRWIPYQAAEVVRRLRPSTVGDVAPAAPGYEYSRPALEAMSNLRLLEVGDLHGDPAITAMHAFAPDLGLSLAAPILRPALFAGPRLGTLNLHKGRLPDYRGMPPAFWEFWNDERVIGCTVHWVDSRLDTGAVAAETTVARERYATPKSVQLRLDEVGVDLVRDVVRDVLGGSRAERPQPTGGRTYRKPTLAQQSALERRLRKDEPASEAAGKRWAKAAFHSIAVAAAGAGLRRATAPRITVLLYHRVSDEVRDNLTVGAAQFDRHMDLLRRHCHVLSIEEVLATEVVPRSQKPLVCVTFDDGYLDNHTNAAPILVRHGIPAAFFVSTGIVATDRRFPHDVRRENPPIPVMDWADLRSMKDAGFTIGSHSVTHIDCADEPEEVVRRELAQSRDDLVRELAVRDPIFAYPYGGRDHMTADRLELVKQAGYVGCLSAYGGSNVGRVDRFNVKRRGIHWEYSDSAFMYECLGLG